MAGSTVARICAKHQSPLGDGKRSSNEGGYTEGFEGALSASRVMLSQTCTSLRDWHIGSSKESVVSDAYRVHLIADKAEKGRQSGVCRGEHLCLINYAGSRCRKGTAKRLKGYG
jgi:hypothetical protein